MGTRRRRTMAYGCDAAATAEGCDALIRIWYRFSGLPTCGRSGDGFPARRHVRARFCGPPAFRMSWWQVTLINQSMVELGSEYESPHLSGSSDNHACQLFIPGINTTIRSPLGVARWRLLYWALRWRVSVICQDSCMAKVSIVTEVNDGLNGLDSTAR